MSENIFFDRSQLKACGENVIIGKTVRIRYPELVEIGDNVIIDDFTYISTALIIEGDVHIAAGCKLIGGRNSLIELRRFSTLAPNVVLAAGSDDYVSGIASPMVPLEYKGLVQIGKIVLGRHSIVGANSTILPNVIFDDGAAVGAQSLVKVSLEAWSLYAGTPAKNINLRDKEKILSLEYSYIYRE
ncbi:MAG: LPS biosynthesis O-acetyl transferase [Aquirhabdus sp.]